MGGRLGWDVTAAHTDNDMSPYKGKRRPGYEKLMAAVESDEIAVVAWHPIVHTARLRS
jgi:site-specific DNA recombinase